VDGVVRAESSGMLRAYQHWLTAGMLEGQAIAERWFSLAAEELARRGWPCLAGGVNRKKTPAPRSRENGGNTGRREL